MTNPTDERSEQDAEWQLADVAFPHDERSFTLVPAERIVEAAQSLLKTIADLGRSYQPGDRTAVFEVLAVSINSSIFRGHRCCWIATGRSLI